MEKERRFLIWKDGKEFFSPILRSIFPNLIELIRSTIKNGEDISQCYLDRKAANQILNELGIIPKFKPEVVRLRAYKGKYFITVKSHGLMNRHELQMEISKRVYLKFSKSSCKRLEKTRLQLPYFNHTLEIDVFKNRALILAEIEGNSTPNLENIPPPGKDVTFDSNYQNYNLSLEMKR